MRLFYLVVLGVSLTGAGQSATGWLNWLPAFAFLAVAAVELGGVALSLHADRRRQLGERAIAARVLSAAIACGAVAVNYFGHISQPGQAAFFSGMSATGYAVYLIDSSARRRDALRESGQLPPAPPAYGPGNWVRHFFLTRRARALAMVNAEARMAQEQRLAVPGAPPETRIVALTGLASLEAARAAVRAERRSAAIATALRDRISQHVDPTMAEIAVHTYDLDEIAARLAKGADYDGLTAILAAELLPAKLHRPADADGSDANPVRDVLMPAPVVPLTARLLPLVSAEPIAIEAGAGRPAIGRGPGDSADVPGSDRSSVVGRRASDVVEGRAVPDAADAYRTIVMSAHRAVPDAAVPDRTVPDARVPDQSVPDHVVLDRAVPDAVVPEVVVSDRARANADGPMGGAGRWTPRARRAPEAASEALSGPIDPDQMTDEEKRQDARELYRASVASGRPLKGAELSRLYKQTDPKWGNRRIRDVRQAEGQATTEATGEFPVVKPATVSGGE